ncbi:MAG: hypothetical protein ACREGB_00885 [Candidatus Saccharimonadales bacterium]
MQINSYQRRHKLGLALLLLAFFAVPFVLQWQNLKQHDTSPFMAGGAIMGKPEVDVSSQSAPVSNNSSAMTVVAGKTLLGTLVQ